MGIRQRADYEFSTIMNLWIQMKVIYRHCMVHITTLEQFVRQDTLHNDKSFDCFIGTSMSMGRRINIREKNPADSSRIVNS